MPPPSSEVVTSLAVINIAVEGIALSPPPPEVLLIRSTEVELTFAAGVEFIAQMEARGSLARSLEFQLKI